MSIKPKLKHFLLCTNQNWLATSSAIKNRGMEVDDICKRCGMEKKTREHLFFHCVDSALVWKLAPLNWESILRTTESFENWWLTIFLANQAEQIQERMELTVYILWYIWKARCAWYFENHKWDAEEIIQKALAEWQEFKLYTKKTTKGLKAYNRQKGK